jgi:hypothetical protein
MIGSAGTAVNWFRAGHSGPGGKVAQMRFKHRDEVDVMISNWTRKFDKHTPSG